MNFRDVPNLLKFEQHARAHMDDEIVIDCYKRIREVISPVPKPPEGFEIPGAPVDGLKASCEAVEKATRLIWACAAATNEITPPLWDYVPDYTSTLDYFQTVRDLDLMALTQKHRISWEIVTPAV